MRFCTIRLLRPFDFGTPISFHRPICDPPHSSLSMNSYRDVKEGYRAASILCIFPRSMLLFGHFPSFPPLGCSTKISSFSFLVAILYMNCLPLIIKQAIIVYFLVSIHPPPHPFDDIHDSAKIVKQNDSKHQ
ncbi:hypothetical protein PM082_007335 [Marasmius tenuissimus]|nr:hypothetical protein PM082_007335 [Marasmius tenuissimus]